jgi:hypothetical protein
MARLVHFGLEQTLSLYGEVREAPDLPKSLTDIPK